jgi:periplasmic divalent cation tolerance protein
MTPLPIEPAGATGPIRLVLSAYPTDAAARRAVNGALHRRLAACASAIAQRSVFVWRGRRTTAEETLVVFKTAPKTVGALVRYIGTTHPYDVPEVVELDVARAEPGYLSWLLAAVDPSSAAGPGHRPRRRAGRRGRGGRAPGRTRGPPRRRSTRTRTS